MRSYAIFLCFILIPLLQAVPGNAVVGSLSGSTLIVPATVSPEGSASLLVYAANSTDPVSGATVTLSVTNGSIVGVVSGLLPIPFIEGQTIEIETNSSGYIEIIWQAPSLNFDLPSLSVGVVADIFYAPEGLSLSLQDTINVEYASLDDLYSISSNISSVVLAGLTVPIEITISDSSGNPSLGVQVTLQIPVGNFSQSASDLIQGITDTDGKYVAIWNAPNLTVETPVLNSSLEILAELSPTINKSVSIPFAIVLSTNETLQLDFLGPSQIDEGEIVEFPFVLSNGNGSVEGAELIVSSTQGLFKDNGTFLDTETQMTTNSSGFAMAIWKAPLLDENVVENVHINVFAQLGLNSKEFSYELSVNPVLTKVDLNWNSRLDGWLQNETIEVSILVTENETSQPLQNISLQLSSEIGQWNESSSSTTISLTSQNGIAKAYLDVSDVNFEFELNEVNILVTVVEKKVEGDPIHASLIVQKVDPFPSATSSVSATSVLEGENISVMVDVAFGEIPVTGVTVEFISTGGTFASSTSGVENVYRLKTEDGTVEVFWVAPDIQEGNSTFFITINIVYNGKTQQLSMYEITVLNINRVSSSPSTSLDLSPSNPQTQVIGALAGIAAITGGSVAVVVAIRKSKG